MFVQTEVTPNPNSLKFLPGKKVSNSGPYEITNKDETQNVLVRNLLSINGVEGIFLGEDFISINKKEKIKWVWSRVNNIKKRLFENFHFFISTIAGHVSIHGGLIILANFVNNTVLGEFALAEKVALLMRMIPVFFTQAILQKATIFFEKDKTQFNSYVNKIFIIGLSITFGMGLTAIILSKWIIFLLAGSHVIYSESILKILAFIPFLSMLNFNNMIKILVEEKKQLLTKASWITAIVMLILATIGSYYYGG